MMYKSKFLKEIDPFDWFVVQGHICVMIEFSFFGWTIPYVVFWLFRLKLTDFAHTGNNNFLKNVDIFFFFYYSPHLVTVVVFPVKNGWPFKNCL